MHHEAIVHTYKVIIISIVLNFPLKSYRFKVLSEHTTIL
jgi:hypothetical protein